MKFQINGYTSEDGRCAILFAFLPNNGHSLTHCILVDSSTVVCWTSPFVILMGVGSILSLLFYF